MILVDIIKSILHKSRLSNDTNEGVKLKTFNKPIDHVFMSPKKEKLLSVIYKNQFYISDIGYNIDKLEDWDLESLSHNLKKHKEMMYSAKNISERYFSKNIKASSQDLVSFTQDIHQLVHQYGGGACGEFVQSAFYEILRSIAIDIDLPLFFYAIQMEVKIIIHKPGESRHIRTPMQHTIGFIDTSRIEFEGIKHLHDLKASKDCVVIDPWNGCEVLSFTKLDDSILLDLKNWEITKKTHNFVIKPGQLKRLS